MAGEQTPISKYLASLEKRQAMLTPSPAPDPTAIIRRINFEDDTFFQQGDQSLNLSASPDLSVRSGNKRKRLSVLGEVLEEEETQQRMSDLERLLQQTQGELIEARAMNTKLEHQICQVKRAHSERIIEYESSHNEMRSKLRDATEQTESFKDQVNKLTKREDELREKVHEQTEAHLTKTKDLEGRLRESETELLDLKTKFESGTLKQSDELRKLSANLEETEMGAEKWVMETQLLRDQLEMKDQHLQKYQTELKEAQAIICKYNELRSRFDQPPSPDGTVAENLTEKLRRFENLYVQRQTDNIRLVQKLEKISDENRMLRSSMDKEMLLEEQISAFEDEVRALRSTLETMGDVETEKISLKADLSAWKKMALKLDLDCTDPSRFETYIRRLQNQLLEARHESSTLKLNIAEKDRCIAKGLTNVTTLEDQVKRLTASNEQVSQEIKKLTRRFVLVTKDRDGLKDLKESYEQEFDGVISKPLQTRINQLEATVAEYEALIQEDPLGKKACSECEKRIALVSEIRSEMERLKREKSEVEMHLANLNTTESGNDGDTTGVKIVSFGMNPSALSLEARLKEAVKENEELKEKIKELQDQTTVSAAPSSSQASQGNLKELEDKNKTLERRLEILSEAYDFETQQLQVIINKLFGFDFTLVREPSVQIRLSSIYSQTPNSAFIFQESPNGDMLLLESPVLNSFRADIDRFLLRDGSIPSFLASVTITYVQNQSGTSQRDSQQSGVADPEADDTGSGTVSVHNPREVQVEVERQRRPTNESADEHDDEEGEDEEEVGDDLEEEDAEPDDEEEEDDDAMGDDEMEEEDELYDEAEHEEDPEEEDGDEEERECESPPPAPYRRGQQNPPRPPPPAADDSDDSDVIMID